MRIPAPLSSVLALSYLLISGGAGAVTLEEYFFDFSDRERGVYLTGVLDLFAADSSRDPEYRLCVVDLGQVGIHEAVSDIVREDPRLLSFDAALWILYDASRQCNDSASASPMPDPRALLPDSGHQTAEGAGLMADLPELTGSPDPGGATGDAGPADVSLPPPIEGAGSAGSPTPIYRDWRYILPALLLAFAGFLAAVAAGRLGRLGRRRRRTAPAADIRRIVRRPASSGDHG